MPKLHISVPAGPDGNVHVQLAEWMLEARLRPPAGWEVSHDWYVGYPTCANRNAQARDALARGADWLLVVDSDALPDMAGLRLLLEAAARPDVDVVAGWTVIGHPVFPLRPCIYHLPERVGAITTADEEIISRPFGLHELKTSGVGTHCVLIARRVLEAFKEKGVLWFEDVYCTDKADPRWSERIEGHDFLFCRRAMEMGFRLWVDTRVFWGHSKTVDLRRYFRDDRAARRDLLAQTHAVDLLRRLWGNTTFSAPTDYLMRLAMEVATMGEGICVECGSGLTSALLAEMLPTERLVTLEEDEGYGQETARKRPGLSTIWHAPLKDYGGFQWYGLPPLAQPVSLVVCDGPRRATCRGGRVGALPVLLPHLAPEFTILLDDAHDPSTDAMLKVWAAHGPRLEVETVPCPDGRAFAVVKGRREG